MNVSIYYHPEAYTTSAPKLMGRHAAGESFLTAFLRHNTNEELWVQVGQESHGRDFEERFAQLIKGRKVHYLTPGLVSVLDSLKACFFPGPGIAKSALQRTLFNDKAWALTGITHTTASAGAMDEITQLVSHPVQTWDALICTSQSVKTHVERLIQQQLDYFSHRFRTPLSQPSLPMLPVIPLGVNCDDFTTNDDTSRQARSVLGVGAAELVVLFVGRLSFHAKAHPLAMYQALQGAMQHLAKGQELLLLELGWHANEPLSKAFSEAAQWAAPQLRTLHLDSRNPDLRSTGWAAGDIFCSLSDNLQEAFGITPIEAMAAGMPTVVSDWDGYRVSVEDGVTGFRVPTSMPGPGQGGGLDLARRHALGIDNYDLYSGFTSSLVGVDIAATTEAFRRLFKSPDLRKKMGEAGRQRAQSLFDWSVVIQQYETLWQGLADIRKAATLMAPSLWPARQDPFQIFASYPTTALGPDSLFQCQTTNFDDLKQRLRNCLNLAMVSYARGIMPSEADLCAMLEQAFNKVVPAQTLVAALPTERQALGLRGLAWMVKLGLLQQVSRTPEIGR